MCKKFIKRSYHEKELKKTIRQVAEMDRNGLLRGRTREKKNPQTILVTTRYSKLYHWSIYFENYFQRSLHSKIYKQKPTVTYQKTNPFLITYLMKNDIANQQLRSHVLPCGKCKLCSQINTVNSLLTIR